MAYRETFEFRRDMTRETDPNNTIAYNINRGANMAKQPLWKPMQDDEYFGYWYKNQFGTLPEQMTVTLTSHGWYFNVNGTHYVREGATGFRGFRAFKTTRV